MPGGELLSVVVPVFNEVEGIARFHERCAAALAVTGLAYEIVYVDDGSRDGSWEALERLAAADTHVRLVRLSRNFGHQLAISAGLADAAGDAVVAIDADLQDPPELIPTLVARWRDGADVVYAVRRRRAGESRFKRATATAFYRMLHWLADVDMPLDAGDFRLMSRRAVDALLSMPEHDRFVRGMVAWIGYETASVEFERDPRFAGETKYPLTRMGRLALDGFVGFSMRPLRLATWLGLLVSATAFVLAVYFVIIHSLGRIPVQGWTSLAVLILLVGGVQLVTIGVIGEYLGRVYNEVRGRPLYLVRDRRGFAEQAGRTPHSTATGERPGVGDRTATDQRPAVGDRPAAGQRPGAPPR
jgi:dolichol-phosphate mannosyltransferase